MRNFRLILVVVFLIIFIPIGAHGENNGDGQILDQFVMDQLRKLNIHELELILEDIIQQEEISYPKLSVKDAIFALLKGEKILDFNQIKKGIVDILFLEVKDNLRLIIQVLAITIACAILTNLNTSFEGENISQIAYYACFIVLGMLTINSFMMALDLGQKTVTKMVKFMQIILPLLLTLLTAISGPNTKILFHPLILGTISLIAFVIKNLIFPLILFTFTINIISNISEKVQFSQLAGLFRQTIIGIITGALTIFIGIITIFGIGSKVDGMTIRTAKFAVDNLIPIVGKFLSDAVETVVSCSAILKNGIGLTGLIALFLICLVPIIRIGVLIFSYKLIGAIAQTIASENIINFFSEVSKVLLLVLIAVLSVATMFFITIGIIVEIGNTTIMLR